VLIAITLEPSLQNPISPATFKTNLSNSCGSTKSKN
jgi:hypothetical protein